MPISELGYRHWEGSRTGIMRRCLAITRSEVAIAFGGSKMLRRALFLAWMPILYFCPIFLAIGYVADPANELGDRSLLIEIAREFFSRGSLERLREDPELILPRVWAIAFYYFLAYTQSFFAVIVVAIVGPPLIAKDVRSKAFLVYFSKPIQPWQYLLGKLSTVAFFVFCLTLFPALVLYAIGTALSPDAGTLQATLPIIFRIVLASLMIAVPIAMVVLLLSSLTKDRRIATFTWIAVWIFGEIAFRILTVDATLTTDFEPPAWASLLSLRELTTTATAGIFELQTSIDSLLELLGPGDRRVEMILGNLMPQSGEADYPPLVSTVFLVGLSVCCAFFVLRRVTKPVRI